MIRRYEFKCEQSHITEQFVDSNIREVNCEVCDSKAKRIISSVATKLEGTSGDFPGEAIKWARRHEKAASKR
jgi:Zn finger protein HypA/HybF involved in hydrogenase expression